MLLSNSLWWPIYVINSVDYTKFPLLYSLTDTAPQLLSKITPFPHLTEEIVIDMNYIIYQVIVSSVGASYCSCKSIPHVERMVTATAQETVMT